MKHFVKNEHDIIKTAKMSTKGQIVIPLGIREMLGLETEDEMVITVHGDNIIMRKIHLGDIFKEARVARKNKTTLSHEKMTIFGKV